MISTKKGAEMVKERLKLSYRIEERISKQLDMNMGLVALDEGFEVEPYATGFNFLTDERELIYDKLQQSKKSSGD